MKQYAEDDTPLSGKGQKLPAFSSVPGSVEGYRPARTVKPITAGVIGYSWANQYSTSLLTLLTVLQQMNPGLRSTAGQVDLIIPFGYLGQQPYSNRRLLVTPRWVAALKASGDYCTAFLWA